MIARSIFFLTFLALSVSAQAREQQIISFEQANISDASQLINRDVMVISPELLDLVHYDPNPEHQMAYSSTDRFYGSSDSLRCAFSLSPVPDIAATNGYALDPSTVTTWHVSEVRPGVKIVGTAGVRAAECKEESVPSNFRRACERITSDGSLFFGPDELIMTSPNSKASLIVYSMGSYGLVQCLSFRSVALVKSAQSVRLSLRKESNRSRD